MYKNFHLKVIACTILLFGHISSSLHAQEPYPNIIFIVADQMRGDALRILGNLNAHTPNLDRMAITGKCFG